MEADLLLVNGQVVTVDDQESVHQAVAVLGGRILAVGPTDRLMELRGPGTRVLDVQGRAGRPGLIDAHAHVAHYGRYHLGLDLRYPAVKSIADIQAKVREAATATPPGQWIEGRAYNQNKLEEGRHPTRWDLDAAAPEHPVALTRVCGHISVVNSRALALVGLHDESPDPPGGRLGRGPDGRLNGVLYEAAQRPVRAATLPSPEKLRRAILEGAKGFLSYGITTVHDAGGQAAAQFRVLREVRGQELKLRDYNFVIDFNNPVAFMEHFAAAGITTGFGDQWVRVGPFKLVSDGSTSGPTAATREPYDSNPHDCGILYYEQEELDEHYLTAHRGGLQLTAHAVGDRAIEMVVTAMERAFARQPRPDPRPRMEHCALLDPGLIARIRRLGLVPAAQPVFFHEFGDGYLRDYGKRTRFMFPCRTLLEQGVPVAASSDCPVTTCDPFLGMYEAMTRATSGGQTVYAEETVTLPQAIRMYTRNGAYAAFEEGVKGSLEPGKLADLAVLSGPILGLPAEEVRHLRADMTIVGGEVVFDRGAIAG